MAPPKNLALGSLAREGQPAPPPFIDCKRAHPGIPTMFEGPITTQFLPFTGMSNRCSSSMHPAGGHPIPKGGSPSCCHGFPTFRGKNPPPSFPNEKQLKNVPETNSLPKRQKGKRTRGTRGAPFYLKGKPKAQKETTKFKKGPPPRGGNPPLFGPPLKEG
eukprot:FR741704.1.p1 GENE.FR741704.1~~FR741704.1.p1  ORF type:complete len:160 (+),score=54.61 FR741704.1:498-977(+)